MAEPLILVINPGSTSTKVSLYKGREAVFSHNEEHNYETIQEFPDVISQADFREEIIRRNLTSRGYKMEDIDVFIGRGGLLRPISGGVYAVSKKMVRELSEALNGEHPCNLGAVLAEKLAAEFNAPAYIADPVVVDELDPECRISGHPAIKRKSVFHALNQKMVAEKASKDLGKEYAGTALIVAHIGGGVSVGVHKKGRVIDVNNALEGEGPMSPERTGGLPLIDFYRYVTEHGLSGPEIYKLVTKKGGLIAYAGTNDCREIEKRIAAGDKEAEVVYKGFVLQVAKAIAAGTAVLRGEVDAVVLTGNVAKGKIFSKELKKRIGFIAPVMTYTDNLEMDALAFAALDAYTGRKKVQEY
jgi:butyrate kinase